MVDEVLVMLFPTEHYISNNRFRKIFGRNHRQDLTPEVVSQMSVTLLAEQRKALEDAAFDSE
jgi:hypothetical protein